MKKEHLTGKQYIEHLEKLADASAELADVFLPCVNYGASFLNADAIAALNDFRMKLRILCDYQHALKLEQEREG